MELVLLFPGQGSQKPGMGRDLADAFPAAREVFDEADAALGSSLSSLCFDGPAEELTRTHNAQPALLAHGAAVWATVRGAVGDSVRAAAGHSLGEFTAYHAAGALSLSAAARLVRRRGELMFEAGSARPGTMAAIIGDMHPAIDEVCETASAEAGLVVPANYNAPGQVVISGEPAGVERAGALAKAAGAKRVLPLNVSGAFHSPLMAPAADGLRDALRSAEIGAPRIPIHANVDASPVTEAARAEQLLVQQLVSPVRWTSVIESLVACYPEAVFVEMGPGAVLTGLMKRIAPAARAMPCGTASEVHAFLELVH